MRTQIGKILIALVAVFTLASCSYDEDTVEMIEGNYTGWTSASFTYSPRPIVSDDETMTIKANDKNANITCTFNDWGTLNVSSATVEESGDNAIIKGEGTILMPGMHTEDATPYDATLQGTVALDKSKFELTIDVPSVMGGTTIIFRNGEAPAEE